MKQLKVLACGICRTDAKIFFDGHRDYKTGTILGHEICAFDELSAKRFVVFPGIVCGHCENCQNGRENLCKEIQILGFHRDGGFENCIADIPEWNLLEVPNLISNELATLAEPLGCALHAISKLKLNNPPKNALIVGSGVLGVMIGIALKHYFNPQIKFVDKNASKYEHALSCFSSNSLLSHEDNDSFDFAINACADKEAFLQLITKLTPGGALLFFSGLSHKESIEAGLLNEVHYKEINMVGSYGCTKNDMKSALDLISKAPTDFVPFIEKIISAKILDKEKTAADWEVLMRQVYSGEHFRYVLSFV